MASLSQKYRSNEPRLFLLSNPVLQETYSISYKRCGEVLVQGVFPFCLFFRRPVRGRITMPATRTPKCLVRIFHNKLQTPCDAGCGRKPRKCMAATELAHSSFSSFRPFDKASVVRYPWQSAAYERTHGQLPQATSGPMYRSNNR